MARTIEELDRLITELQQERWLIQDEAFKQERLPKLLGAIGKTFVYRGCAYSCPEKPSDYWDIFRQLVRVDVVETNVKLLFRRCQIDRDGIAELKLEERQFSTTNSNDLLTSLGWTECDPAEFKAAWLKTEKALYEAIAQTTVPRET